MLMWEVFAQGEKPFSGLTPYQLMHAVVVDNTRPRFPAYCPDELVALGGQCMSANPLLRPSFEQVCDQTCHIEGMLTVCMKPQHAETSEARSDAYGSISVFMRACVCCVCVCVTLTGSREAGSAASSATRATDGSSYSRACGACACSVPGRRRSVLRLSLTPCNPMGA